jgi:ATP-dependent NAD(P)H-hydrate dehydratase
MRYVVGLQVDYNGCTFLQDGLWFVHLQPELIAGYTNCAITPNAVEFDRLCVACNVHEQTAHALAHGLQGGRRSYLRCDYRYVSSSDTCLQMTTDIDCDERGSLRRCGGQGDLLSGALGVFSYWTSRCARCARMSNCMPCL